MRIALLTYSTRPRGGVVHTLALAEALAARGEDVTVWTLGRGGDRAFFRPVDPAVRVEVVPFLPSPDEGVGARILRSIRTLAAAFDPGGYDVVHAEDCITANAVPGCIRTVHHLDRFTTPELAACHDRAITGPAALVTVSAAVAAEVRAGYGRAATVIGNGVDDARFAAAAGPAGAGARASLRHRFGDYLLLVGGIEPRKGALDALEGFALARRRHPRLRLVVAGGETLFDYAEYRRRFDARAAELAVPVEVLGPVDHAVLPALVAEARALPFLSTKEGFGLAAMEALAASVPVIARDLPVIREVFGDAVLTVPDDGGAPAALAAVVARVLSGGGPDPAAGRALAARTTWDAAAAAHQELYASVLAPA
ncbi:MSMEG_0565 family glycosyltransferase [Amnibacterium endophyticum]|uniref:MSMEG_0565 family glycosyltransferase n=1 Tax=Amnibacterium endophyticum TaxID=2109337 RepID=A0ABW4LD53_9MICO